MPELTLDEIREKSNNRRNHDWEMEKFFQAMLAIPVINAETKVSGIALHYGDKNQYHRVDAPPDGDDDTSAVALIHEIFKRHIMEACIEAKEKLAEEIRIMEVVRPR